MPFFETPANYSLHYELHGDGPEKVLLVMGFACCKSYWYPLVDRLLEWGGDEAKEGVAEAGSFSRQPPRHPAKARRAHHLPQQPHSAAAAAPIASSPAASPSATPASRYQVLCFDSRGFGLSGDSFARYSSSSLARDVKALLMHVGWIRPEKALLALDHAKHRARQSVFEARWSNPASYTPPPLHIVGWSMGGMIATELTLELSRWGEACLAADPLHPAMDFRSAVITSSSRGGFRHQSDSFDAEPIVISDIAGGTGASNGGGTSASSSATPPSGGSSSLLKRLLRRSSVGRWGWGRTWFLRNLPPPSGLARIFRLVFLSLAHSRIERVLELHYSPEFLAQPYKPETGEAGKDGIEQGESSSGGSGSGSSSSNSGSKGDKLSLPSASALSHLPQTTAALTSGVKPTIEIRADAESGGFSWSQQADAGVPEAAAAAVISPDMDDSDDEDEDAPVEKVSPPRRPPSVEPAVQVLQHAKAELAPDGPSLQMTPAQKQRVLQREEKQEDDDGLLEGRDLSAAFSSAVPSPPPTSTSLHSPPAPPSLPPSSPRHGGPGAPHPHLLTNRDVLSSQYLLRAPFDRFIVLYAYALFGHGLVCLTHHVSRKRIREFMRRQEVAAKTQRHQLRLQVVTGSADILVHPSNSYHLSEQLQCPLYVLEHVGHMVHVEQPDVFAQLLHAHFARLPIEHLQAYTHAQQAQQAQAAATSPQPSPDMASAKKTMTVTRMADSDAEGNGSGPAPGSAGSPPRHLRSPSMSPQERAQLSARGAHSRRNSFLVQIAGDSPAGLSRNDSTASLNSTHSSPRVSASSAWATLDSVQAQAASASSLQRRPSVSVLRQQEQQRSFRRPQRPSICARSLAFLFSLPVASVSALVDTAIAVPPTLAEVIVRPWRVVRIPGRIFSAFKLRLGGSVLKLTGGDAQQQGSHAELQAVGVASPQQPVARILTL